jgi:hypothetical protein
MRSHCSYATLKTVNVIGPHIWQYMCVLILPYMCPHTQCICPNFTLCVLIGNAQNRQRLYTTLYICVLILLYMCPHTTLYVSSYYSVRVRILL